MFGDLAKSVIEGFLAPRASSRRMLAGDHRWDAIILMAVFAYLVTATFEVMMSARLSGPSVTARHVGGIMNTVVTLIVVAFLATRLGRILGGTGTFKQLALVVSWQQVVTSFLSPFWLPLYVAWLRVLEAAERDGRGAVGAPGIAEIGGAVLVSGVAAAAYACWLLASYIAEAHGFRSAWGVMIVMIGLPLLAVFVLMNLTGARPI